MVSISVNAKELFELEDTRLLQEEGRDDVDRCHAMASNLVEFSAFGLS